MTKRSIFGLSENVAAALSYLFGPISGIIALILERENKFVRFHALQSTLWFLLLYIVGWVVSFIAGIFGAIPVIGTLFGLPLSVIVWAVGALTLVTRLILMWKAFTGKECKIPMIGDVAWAQTNK